MQKSIAVLIISLLIAGTWECKKSPTEATSSPVDLAFSPAVGTTWTYRYDGESADPPFLTLGYGTHIWHIVSISESMVFTVYSLNDDQNDTVKNSSEGSQDTSVSCSSRVVPFTIVESPDLITINFPETGGGIVHQIPRYVAAGSDTVTSDSSNTWASDVLWFVRGVGVVHYSYYHDFIHATSANLTLVSFSKP